MAYKQKSICSTLNDINSGEMYLPAIQRKYVWSEDQIARLMDSIMLGYPIGTFLFWKVKKTVINDKEYFMYEFIKDYHERDTYKNPAAPQPFLCNENDYISAVLDGQQRLTSLYIALQGSMSKKLPNKRWSNDDAFPKKELYFNLHSEKETEDDDITYEFTFLTKEGIAKISESKVWYKVKDILKYENQTDVMMNVVMPNEWNVDTLAMKNILLLHERLVTNEIINYFDVEKDSIDNVLDIFVRVNSGGTVLSKTDLLFSTIVSHWDKARDEIDELLLSINKYGEGYRFSNDFIMRTCLYLLDISVTLKVETFKKDSVLKIKDNWDDIKSAIKDTVELLADYGFNFENIISYVAIMPIVYYRFKKGVLEQKSKPEIRKYLVMAQVKQIFGTASNSVLTSIRDVLSKPCDVFPLKALQELRFTGDRNLKYSEEEIDSLFDTLQIGAYTFMILSLLYPNLKYSQKGFHQDHMHPHTSFEDKNMVGFKLDDGSLLDDEKKMEWKHKRNTLANLQLLEGRENGRKNATPLTQWLKEPSNKENAKYLPESLSYELSHFESFLEARQKLMSDALKSILL